MDDNLSYVSEFEHTSPRCRAPGARYGTDGDRGSLNEVARLLQRLLSAGEAGGRTGSVIEILVMQALTPHAGGDTPSALAALERAPTLAEPEGYVQVFVGEGPPMASLLTAVASRGPGGTTVVDSWPPVPMTVRPSPCRPSSDRPPASRMDSSSR